MDTKTIQRNPWGRLLVFLFAILLPSIAIGVSTLHVMPDAFWMILFSLAITVGISALLSFYAGHAMDHVARYCIITHLILGLALYGSYTLHIALARELSMARSSTADIHVEEDRAAKLRADQAAQAERLLKAQAELAEKQARLNYSTGRRGVKVTPPALNLPQMSALPARPESFRAPEAIRQSWSGWLLWTAVIDGLLAIVGALVLAALWEWDRNGDGIPDRLQKPKREEFPSELDVDEKPVGKFPRR
jgi:hypothetical protein